MALLPEDFPKGSTPGAVPGAQPKLLVRQEGGRFVTGAHESEVLARYEICEDLARQLAQYTSRKSAEHPAWTQEQLQAKVAAGLKAKAFGWGLSPAEADWVLRRVATLAGAAVPRATS